MNPYTTLLNDKRVKYDKEKQFISEMYVSNFKLIKQNVYAGKPMAEIVHSGGYLEYQITKVSRKKYVKVRAKMKKYLKLILGALVISIILIGCASEKKDNKDSSLIQVNADDLIYKTTISPNKEYVKKKDLVYYNIEVYQNEDCTIIVNANSNSAFFEDSQYILEYGEKISESDVDVKWTTLMGNTEYTEDDTLAIANVSISKNNEVFSERKINFVKGGIEIILDIIEKNK